jgi:hypothetical protein
VQSVIILSVVAPSSLFATGTKKVLNFGISFKTQRRC